MPPVRPTATTQPGNFFSSSASSTTASIRSRCSAESPNFSAGTTGTAARRQVTCTAISSAVAANRNRADGGVPGKVNRRQVRFAKFLPPQRLPLPFGPRAELQVGKQDKPKTESRQGGPLANAGGKYAQQV